MGRPKALLPVGGETFIRRILRTLKEGGAAPAVVVVRPHADEVLREIAEVNLGRAVVNPDPDRGQLSSLLAGLAAVETPGLEGVLVTLVDVPLVSPATVSTLLARAAESRAAVLRAACHGRHGHPVIFRSAVFDALRAADPASGARAVMRAYPVEDVEVDDPGVAEDVDTPADYDRLIT
jgi:CTP:molybdopterin cytidylyltransferase MocA